MLFLPRALDVKQADLESIKSFLFSCTLVVRSQQYYSASGYQDYRDIDCLQKISRPLIILNILGSHRCYYYENNCFIWKRNKRNGNVLISTCECKPHEAMHFVFSPSRLPDKINPFLLPLSSDFIFCILAYFVLVEIVSRISSLDLCVCVNIFFSLAFR